MDFVPGNRRARRGRKPKVQGDASTNAVGDSKAKGSKILTVPGTKYLKIPPPPAF